MALFVVLIFIAVAVLIQIPAIQNKIVHYATSFVSNKTHTRVEIKNISISFPKSVVIEGLFLDDLRKDTLLYAGRIKINIALYALISSKISISSVTLDGVNLNLYNTGIDSVFNYNFLLTAFSDTSAKAKSSPPTTSKWTISVGAVSLNNIRLHYNDAFAGMNVSAKLVSAQLKMDQLDLAKSLYDVDELLVEKLDANVRITKTSTAAVNNPDAILPRISANIIRINHSTVSYTDSIARQSVMAVINRFELNKGSVDLQNELVTFGKLSLSKSEIQYNTIDTTYYSDSTIAIAVATSSGNWKVKAKSIYLDDNTLSYQVNNKPETKHVFDVYHLVYKHLTLDAADFSYSSDTTRISIKKFSATDQNNFSITGFETYFSMDRHSITAKNLKAATSHSSIIADLKINYSSLESLKDSIPYLVLDLNLAEVSIQNADVLYFSPQLGKQEFFKNSTNKTFISGIVQGPVNNLAGKNISIKTGIGTILKTDFRISGLPDAETAYYAFPNLKLVTGKTDIAMMAGPSAIPKSIALPASIVLQVAFKGKLKSFEATLGLGSSFGSANAFVTIDKNENFRSNLSLTGFDLGQLLKDTAVFGPVSLTASTTGHSLDTKTIQAKINAEVSQVYLNRYTYHNLTVDGNIRGQQFEGKINLNDKNAEFAFDGLVNLNPGQEKYAFRLDVQGANLQKLYFSKEDIRIGLAASVDLKGSSVNNVNGRAAISSMVIVKGDKVYKLDSVLIASVNETKKSELNISSALIGVKYSGTISPFRLPVELNRFVNNYFRFTDSIPLQKQGEQSDFTFEIQLHNHPVLSQVLLPQLKEFEPGIIRGSFDSEKNSLTLNATMKKIVYGTTEVNDLVLDVNSDPGAVNYKLSSTSVSNSQIKFDNFLLEGKLAENTLFANLSSIGDNLDKKLVIRSQVTRNKSNYRLTLDPKDFFLMNKSWDIAADNYIEFGKDGFLIHKFYISSAESRINVASVHDRFNDDLNIEVKNFKLDDLSRIIEKDTSLIKGLVNGNVLLKRVNNTYGIIADARISSLFVREVPIGDLTVKADNPTAGRFDIDVNLSGTDNNFTVKGYFIPNGGDNSLNIVAAIQSLSMKTVQAFSMGQITEAAGTLQGNLHIRGAATTPEITGELVFNDAFITPAILNNRLELKHETVQLKVDGIYFNSFTLIDSKNNTATIDGSVKMKQFKDFVFDMQVNTKDFQLFNTTAKDNKEFFGRMVIDSRIDIKGPMTLPVIVAKIKMKKGSNFTFAVQEDKLTTDRGEGVVEFEDSLRMNSILYNSGTKAVAKSGFTGFDLSSVIEIDKEATLRLLMDPASTDSLVVRGEAALSFTMDRSGKMSLTGAYNLSDGSYLVSLQSVIKKKFDIIPGSTIIWNGDPLDAEISINATYSVRASPIDLVADQMSGLSEVDKRGYKQKYPFLVLLKLRGEILHPEISFAIQLPPQDKGILGGAVDAKLNMLNEDPSALNKQVFALLVLGRFIQENPLLTDANSGASTVVRATVGKFLSTQLNQLSSKVVPGVELNFDIQSYDDYTTGQAAGRTQVEVGLKKQLFSERLSVQVGGTVDVEGKMAQQNSASDIFSDVIIEYKLVEDGRYRVKGFRQSLYEGAIEGQIVETGFGISYVRDFNKWKDLFRAPRKVKVIDPEKQK